MNKLWWPIGSGQWVGSAPSTRFPVYTRGNAGEVYPHVFRPLSYSLAYEAGFEAMAQVMAGTGLVTEDEANDPAIGSGVFGGYAYLNLSAQRVMSMRMPGGKVTDADRGYLGTGAPPGYVAQKGDRNVLASLRGLRYLLTVLGTKDLANLDRDGERVDRLLSAAPDVDTATDEELVAYPRSLLSTFTEFYEIHLRTSAAAGVAVGGLLSLVEKSLGSDALALEALGGLGEVDSAAPSLELWDLGREVAAAASLTECFDAGVAGLDSRLRAHGDGSVQGFVGGFDRFLERHGARGPNEWDTGFHTWGTKPELALALIDRLRLTDESHDPRRQQQRLAGRAQEAEQELSQALKRRERSMVARFLKVARIYSRGRERSKTNVVRLIHGLRLTSQELARRCSARSGGADDDLWFLVDDEVDAYVADPGSFDDTIAERRAMHERLAERIPPFYFDGELPPLETWELRSATRPQLEPGAQIEGLPGCPGIARGRARVVTDPADPRGLEPGEVLVATLTDPSWTPLFLAAEAVVVDVGAIMSHAVIVSRELGIPCVVSATDATRVIPDGAMVEVDGAAGTVRLIS